MANVPRSSRASIDATSAIQAGNKIPRLPGADKGVAASAIAAPCVPLRLNADGDYVPAAGDTVANAKIIGFSGKGYVAGEPVTAFRENTVFLFSDGGLTPGQDLYIGTAGELADAALANSGAPVARALDESHVIITRAA